MSILRPMQPADLEPVVKFIEAFDEDDGESARSDFEKSGVDDHFVLEIDNEVIGVVGYNHVPETERTTFLSWTYVAEAHRGSGHGHRMLTELIEQLREMGCRKLYVKVSDYSDEEDGDIYGPALKLYKSLGFTLELTGVDFYDAGENQLILGMLLQQAPEGDLPEISPEKAVLQFRTAFEIADSDGAYSFEWYAESKFSLHRTSNFTAEDLTVGVDEVRKMGGRKVFLTFPSNLPLIEEPLRSAGFELSGRLTDYYESGLDELHFTHAVV